MPVYTVGIASDRKYVEAATPEAAALFYGLNTNGNAVLLTAVYEEDGEPFGGDVLPWGRWGLLPDAYATDKDIAELVQAVSMTKPAVDAARFVDEAAKLFAATQKETQLSTKAMQEFKDAVRETLTASATPYMAHFGGLTVTLEKIKRAGEKVNVYSQVHQGKRLHLSMTTTLSGFGDTGAFIVRSLMDGCWGKLPIDFYLLEPEFSKDVAKAADMLLKMVVAATLDMLVIGEEELRLDFFIEHLPKEIHWQE